MCDSNKNIFGGVRLPKIVYIHIDNLKLSCIAPVEFMCDSNKNIFGGVRKLRKTFGKFFRSYSELLSKFGEISFQDYVSQGIAHPVFYGDLVYKLRRVKGEANFISSGSKIVKRLRRRQYDPAIIERTIGLVLGPFTALYRSFLKRCTLTNKAVGTIWRALSKPPQRRQGPDPRPLWLLVGTPSAFGPELAYRLRVAQPTLMDVARYFWYTLILLYMFVYYIFMTSPLWLAVGPQSI